MSVVSSDHGNGARCDSEQSTSNRDTCELQSHDRTPKIEGPAVFPLFWLLPLGAYIYTSLEFVSFLINRDTLVGSLSGGSIGSLMLAFSVYEWILLIHVVSAITLWAAWTLQIYAKCLRTNCNALPHRLLGRTIYLVYFLFMFPSSFCVGLTLAVGPLTSVALLDVNTVSAFCMWRSYRIIRNRQRGIRSVHLHAVLMQVGILTSSAIIIQRSILMITYVCRWALQYLTSPYPELYAFIGSVFPSHATCLSFSLIVWTGPFLVWPAFLVDGVRSVQFCSLFLDVDADYEEVFGIPPPAIRSVYAHDLPKLWAETWDGWAWRLRMPIYAMLYLRFGSGTTTSEEASAAAWPPL